MKRFILHAAAASALALTASTASAATITWADLAGNPGDTFGTTGASNYSFTFDLGATGTIAVNLSTASAGHNGSAVIASNGAASQIHGHTGIQYPDTSTDTLTHTTGEAVQLTSGGADDATITFDFTNYVGIFDELIFAIDHVGDRERTVGPTTINFSTALHLGSDRVGTATDGAGNPVAVGTTGTSFQANDAGAGGDAGDFLFNGITGNFDLNLVRGSGDTVYFSFADEGNVDAPPPPAPVTSPALMSLLLAGMGGVLFSRRRANKS